MGSEVILAALGIVGTLAGALIWLLKKQFTQNEGVLTRLSSSIDGLNQTLATSSKESVEFQSLVLQMLKQLLENTDRNYNALKEQHIGTQVVESQTIVNK